MSIDKPALPPPTLAQYPELILGAIDNKNGATTVEISRHIEAMYGELPAAHSTLLSHHLNKMKQTGELVMYKNKYLKPDPTRPIRRGRGRPPKERVSAKSGDDAAKLPQKKRGRPAKSGGFDDPPRPRGRPKTVDSDAKLAVRPRGRPAKVDPAGALILKRPRGRPGKAKAVKVVSVPLERRGRPRKTNETNAVNVVSSRPRGRPPKNAEAPPTGSRPRGRPKNVESGVNISPRPRGRPPKKNVDAEGSGSGSVLLPETKSPSLSGRKRGRPKKMEESKAKPV